MKRVITKLNVKLSYLVLMAGAMGPGHAAEDPLEPPRAVRELRALGGRVYSQPATGRVVEVDLNHNPRVTDQTLQWVGALPDLTDLSLETTQITSAGLRHLTNLTKLEWLNLYQTRVDNDAMSILATLPALTHLPVGETRVTDDGLKSVGRLTQLRYLGLRGNKITDDGLGALAGLTNLHGLHLGGTGVTAAGLKLLGRLERLEQLWLDDLSLGDENVELLSRTWPRLRELHVHRTRLTAKGLVALRKALPGCDVEASDESP